MTVPVRPDGRIAAPLVEDLPALGKDSTTLARDIEKALILKPRPAEGAAGMLGGVNTFGGRMAPLLGALMMVLAAGWHVRRRVGPAASRWAMALLSLQPLTFVGGQYANLDMLVAGCITLTIVLWSESALRDRKSTRLNSSHT